MKNASLSITSLLLAGAAIPMALLATPASAQEAQDDNTIVVTATKRSEDISKVPIAIEQFDAGDLEDLGVTQPIDLQGTVPGLTIVNTFSDATPIFSIRGVSADDIFPTTSSPVGLYYDEVYAASPLMLVQPVFDLERVEVLKGPQGTLYGRNSSGGAINFISKRPGDELNGYVRLGYGRWDTLDVEGAVGGPIGSGISARISGTITKAGDGYQTDLNTGREFGKPDRGGVRGQVLAEFGAVELLAVAHYAWDRSITASPYSSFIYTGDPRDVTVGDLDLQTHADAPGGSLKLTADLGGMTLTSITSYDEASRRGWDNYDGLADRVLDFYSDFDSSQFGQELRLSSDRPIGGMVDWIVGVTYGADVVDAIIVEDLSDVFYPGTSDRAALQADYRQTTHSVGAYAHLVTHLSDTINLTTGIRYSHDQRRFAGETTDITGGFTFSAPGSVTAQRDESRTSENVSYRIGLDWEATPDVLLYGSVASGYKQGSFYGNPASTQEAWGFTQPESVTSFGMGFKSKPFDRLLTIDGALFYSKFTDRQTLVAVQAPFAVTSALANIPESSALGVELEIVARPVFGLTLSASGTYIDTRIDQAVTDVRGLPVVTPIAADDPLPQAPDFSYTLRGSYEFAIGGRLTGSLDADYSWLDTAISALGDANAEYGPLPLLGASAMIESTDGWSVRVWGRNLTNSKRHTYGFTSIFGDQQFYTQRPISYGVTLGFDF